MSLLPCITLAAPGVGVVGCKGRNLFVKGVVGLGRWSAFIRQECGGIEIGKGEVPNGLNGRQNKALNAGEVAAVEFFNSHIEEVRNDLNALK